MNPKPILNKLESIEKSQGQILFYVRLMAEKHPGGENLPDVMYDDQDVMLKMKWSKSTLKRRRADGVLPFKKVGNKYFYREKDVVALLIGPRPG